MRIDPEETARDGLDDHQPFAIGRRFDAVGVQDELSRNLGRQGKIAAQRNALHRRWVGQRAARSQWHAVKESSKRIREVCGLARHDHVVDERAWRRIIPHILELISPK